MLWRLHSYVLPETHFHLKDNSWIKLYNKLHFTLKYKNILLDKKKFEKRFKKNEKSKNTLITFHLNFMHLYIKIICIIYMYLCIGT